MITSPAHAIELLGGVKVVADRVKKPYTTVASWGVRGSIPPAFWSTLVDFALEKEVAGFTFTALALAQARSAEKRKKADAA